MRINGLGSPTNVRRSSDASRPSGSGQTFQASADFTPQPSARTVGAAPLQSVDALLALQSVDDVLTGRRKAMKRGNDVLDTLEDVKLDLLAGTVEPAKLRRLMRLVEDRTPSGDAPLDSVLDEIELRAMVELAKRDML